MTQVTVRRIGVSLILLILAIVCFLINALGVDTKWGIDIGWIGMAFLAGSFLPIS